MKKKRAKTGPRHCTNREQRNQRQRRVDYARAQFLAGSTVAELADELGVTTSTIKKYISGLGRDYESRDPWRGGPLPELPANEKPRLEDFVRVASPLAFTPESAPDLRGIGGPGFNVKFGAAMKRKKIPTMDPRDERSRMIVP